MTRYRTHPLVDGPPSWASGWGQDRYGVFAEFRVGQAKQRMRWIFSGTFQIGSPKEESGRDDEREWLPHRAKLSQGFWLADTPCTQELWQKVMGENPSRFQSKRRPVEQMSWNDVQTFLGRLHDRRPDLELRLPTEAQWEYACRAGTEEATWRGDLEVLGKANAPVLDDIAWYAGNSGVEFDLEEGFDSSGWEEKQYPHEKAGTRKVARKQPNPWGLYDMLGNVWEWCSDAWEDPHPVDERVDPEGPKEGTLRVIRGGSWSSHARSVRAASRGGYPPDARWSSLGFRLSRGQRRGA